MVQRKNRIKFVKHISEVDSFWGTQMVDERSNDDNFFLDDGQSTMPQRSIFDFGALTQPSPSNMLPAFGSQQETKRERRNRLARERRARKRVVQTQEERARLVEERRLNRNRRRREIYAAKRDRRARSKAAIDAPDWRVYMTTKRIKKDL